MIYNDIYKSIIDSYELHTSQKYIRLRVSNYSGHNKRG